MTLRAKLPSRLYPCPLQPALSAILSAASGLSSLQSDLLIQPPDVALRHVNFSEDDEDDEDEEQQDPVEHLHWNVFHILQLPSLSTSLTSLELWGEETLYLMGGHQWALRILMLRALTSLRALQTLSVWHLLLDSAIVTCLADERRPVRLRMLRVHFLHVHTAPNRKPPLCEVSEDEWGKLRSPNSDLSFQLFSYGFPTAWLVDVICSSPPVTHLRLTGWSVDLASRLTCAGQRALRELHLQDSRRIVDGSVLEVVELSTQLCDLILKGRMTPSDVRRLAGMRGPRWRRLQIFTLYITADSPKASSDTAGDSCPQNQLSESSRCSRPAPGSCLPLKPHPESTLPCSCGFDDFLQSRLYGDGRLTAVLAVIFGAGTKEKFCTARTRCLEELERDVSQILTSEWHLDQLGVTP